MAQRTWLVLGVAFALGACLDFGKESSENEDGDAGDAGDPGSGGSFSGAGGTAGNVATGGDGPSTGGKGGNFATGGKGGNFATGGASTGGVATGGISTGGVSTGGVATGGVATGGLPTGGVSTGGSLSGAGGKGGSGPGGAGAGGAGSGGKGGASGGGGAGSGGKGGSGSGNAGSGGSAGTCATEELLANGDFELGDSEWIWDSYGWSDVIVTGTTAATTPHGGTYLARLGGYEYASDIMNLVTMIPPSATNITLSFYEQIRATYPEYPYTFLAVGLIRDSDSSLLGVLEFDDTNAHTGWVRHDIVIPSTAAGQVVIVVLEAEGYDYEYATLLVDSISLTARVCR